MFNYIEMYLSQRLIQLIKIFNSYLSLQEMNKSKKEIHFKSQLISIDHLGSIDRGD
jgi:hypothetical protein